MEFFIIFITWLVLSIAAAVYASNKGRSGGGILALSLFLSPLVGFLVAAAMEPHDKEIARAKGMKKCPDCAEFVQRDARICRFCRHEFATDTGDTSADTRACPKCNSEAVEICKTVRYADGSEEQWVCRSCSHRWETVKMDPSLKPTP